MLDLLNAMNADGGIIVGFGVFIPFEEGEIAEFFRLCEKAEAVRSELRQASSLRPCPQILSHAERRVDYLAMWAREEKALTAESALRTEIIGFRQRVLDRFQASR
jgi:hypothetical protein